jgi:antitoxin component of MazEF toxin-antitoxin module
MRTTVKKWGNSAAVRIPASVLEDLLNAINRKNLHDPVDFGKPTGKEIW